MRRWVIVIFLIIVLAGLVFYNPIKGAVQILPDEEEPSKEQISEFKILKHQGISITNRIKGVVKNIGDEESPVTLKAELIYRGEVVAEKNITLYNVKLYEEREFEIRFEHYIPRWNAYNVEII